MNGNDTAKNPMMDSTKEPLHVEKNDEMPQQSPLGFLQSLSALVCAYAIYYRNVTSIVLVGIFILLVVIGLDNLVSSIHSKQFHHLQKDYSFIPYSQVELQAAQIDHWCLQGGDDHCRCMDPTEPTSREEVRGWTKTHAFNKQQFEISDESWDLVLLGDVFVEDFAGTTLGTPNTQLKNVKKYWDATFTINGGGSVEGLALGIAGDSIANLLWRIQHGELPESKVYWIHIGTHDFGRGQCSEEAVLLGILRLAEWIHEAYPDSVIVLNSILPRMGTPSKNKRNKKQQASPEILWSAIQEVNAQLESFCVHHEHLVYFDATPLLVNSQVGKKKIAENTLRNPMYLDDKFHLSLQGHKTWGNAILERLKLILYDDDESSS